MLNRYPSYSYSRFDNKFQVIEQKKITGCPGGQIFAHLRNINKTNNFLRMALLSIKIVLQLTINFTLFYKWTIHQYISICIYKINTIYLFQNLHLTLPQYISTPLLAMNSIFVVFSSLFFSLFAFLLGLLIYRKAKFYLGIACILFNLGVGVFYNMFL